MILAQAHRWQKMGTMMLLVSLCLLPGTLCYAWQFGPLVWLQTATCLLFTLLLECMLLRLRASPVRAGLADMSWLVCALILARALPLLTPIWLIALACFAALVLCKHGAGGLGKNRLNPAMVGLGIVAICFYQQLYPAPLPTDPWSHDLTLSQAWQLQLLLAPRLELDAVTGATALSENQLGLLNSDLSWIGYLLGGLLLALLRVIRIEIPLAMIAASLLLNLSAGLDSLASFYSLSQGGYLLTAFFIATDPVTSPDTRVGRILFGLVIGILTGLIRQFGLYADGLCFAVLTANLLVPQLDQMGIWLQKYRIKQLPLREKLGHIWEKGNYT